MKGQRITCCCLGQRWQLKQTINVLKACEEKLGRENVWRIKGIREYPIYSEHRRPYTAQKRMTVQTIKQNSKQKQQQNTENRERRPSFFFFFLNMIPAERGRFVNTPLKHWKKCPKQSQITKTKSLYLFIFFVVVPDSQENLYPNISWSSSKETDFKEHIWQYSL